MTDPIVTIYKGKGKESGKDFTCLKVEIGTWSTLCFPKSKFEMEYIEDYMNRLEDHRKKESVEDFQKGLG